MESVVNSTRANPFRTFHFAVVSYVTLLCLAAIASSGTAKFLANLMAIGVFVIAITNWIFYPIKSKINPSLIFGFLMFYIGMFGSVVSSFQLNELIDALKIAIAPFFLLFGISVANDASKWSWRYLWAKVLYFAMILLPLFAWVIQLGTGATELFGVNQVGIFANRNNAGLYALVLIAFHMTLTNKVIAYPFIYLGCGLMFGTLGLLFSVTTSLVLCRGKIYHLFFALVAAICLLVVLHFEPEVSAALRVKPVIDSLQLLISSRIDLETVTYADLVSLLKTQDLSFLFRLKHWYNIYNVFLAGDWQNWIFGFGSGSSVQLTSIHLVPHNDYIRCVFEFGILTFIGFLTLLVTSVRAIGRGWSLVPVLAVCIYFFSENLINNYIAMVLYFFSVGVLIQRRSLALDEIKDVHNELH